MFIGEASTQSGATIKAIRHYENIGLLLDIKRQGIYRVFDVDDVLTIKFIKMAQIAGFKLTELKSILNRANKTSKWLQIQDLIVNKNKDIDLQIQQLKVTQSLLNEHKKEITLCLLDNKDCKFP